MRGDTTSRDRYRDAREKGVKKKKKQTKRWLYLVNVRYKFGINAGVIFCGKRHADGSC